MMKTDKNPLPPGAKSKSKARQHAKSNSLKKKMEKSNTSSSSSKKTSAADSNSYDSIFEEAKKHFSKEFFEEMAKERFLDLPDDEEIYPEPETEEQVIAYYGLGKELYYKLRDRNSLFMDM